MCKRMFIYAMDARHFSDYIKIIEEHIILILSHPFQHHQELYKTLPPQLDHNVAILHTIPHGVNQGSLIATFTAD